ncbi:MAG: class I SAM-dependent methyltransferase [Bacteroidales bacterium]
MRKVDFDEYAVSYLDIMQKQHKFFGDIDYYSFYKVKLTFSVVKSITSSEKINILEYGCGIGKNLRHLKAFFGKSKVFGYDISRKSLEIARINNPDCSFIYDNHIENYNNFFDLIFIAGVYHHLTPVNRITVTNTIYSLLKNNGILTVFEHNPYNPITRYLVNTCEFDTDAILLTKNALIKLFITNSFKYVKSGYCLFLPPVLKSLNFIDKYISSIPLGGQYYVICIK